MDMGPFYLDFYSWVRLKPNLILGQAKFNLGAKS